MERMFWDCQLRLWCFTFLRREISLGFRFEAISFCCIIDAATPLDVNVP